MNRNLSLAVAMEEAHNCLSTLRSKLKLPSIQGKMHHALNKDVKGGCVQLMLGENLCNNTVHRIKLRDTRFYTKELFRSFSLSRQQKHVAGGRSSTDGCMEETARHAMWQRSDHSSQSHLCKPGVHASVIRWDSTGMLACTGTLQSAQQVGQRFLLAQARSFGCQAPQLQGPLGCLPRQFINASSTCSSRYPRMDTRDTYRTFPSITWAHAEHLLDASLWIVNGSHPALAPHLCNRNRNVPNMTIGNGN